MIICCCSNCAIIVLNICLMSQVFTICQNSLDRSAIFSTFASVKRYFSAILCPYGNEFLLSSVCLDLKLDMWEPPDCCWLGTLVDQWSWLVMLVSDGWHATCDLLINSIDRNYSCIQLMSCVYMWEIVFYLWLIVIQKAFVAHSASGQGSNWK